MASSNLSPPTRTLPEYTMPPSEIADFGRAAAHVDDHRARRLRNRQVGADRSCHRFLNEVYLRRARAERGFADRAALDLRRAAGHADDDARGWAEEPGIEHFLDELLQHL